MVDPELDELKREFLTEASQKVEEMASSVGTTSDFTRLAYLAHQLKGSGGSYGFGQISTDAAEIERTAEEAIENGGSGASSVETIRVYVQRLRAEIERSQSALSDK